MRRKRIALITLFLLVCLFVSAGLWLRAERRQYALNRALIDALVKGDDKRALALVNARADPNTHFTPTPRPSSSELLKQLFHRSPPFVNASHTAFSMACGAFWRNDGMDIHVMKDQDEVLEGAKEYIGQPHRPDPTQLLQAMLAHSANVNAQDKNGLTPLIWATRAHRSNTVQVLLEHGAHVNAKDEMGWTPLITAARSHYLDLIRLLLAYKANINQTDMDGCTPLHWVIGQFRPMQLGGVYWDFDADLRTDAPTLDTLRVLLDAGANVNLQNKKEETPLYSAVAYGVDEKILHILLEHGADPNLADKHNNTPLRLAQHDKHPNLVVLLKRYGARK